MNSHKDLNQIFYNYNKFDSYIFDSPKNILRLEPLFFSLSKHETELELFLIGKNLTYQILLKIIDDNIDNYNYNYRVNELLLENQLLNEKLNAALTLIMMIYYN